MLRRLYLATVFVALLSAPANAQPSYSDVFFFGTSELDAGNWLLNPSLLGNVLAPTAAKGYYDGRWQSGYAWSDYFAQALGHDATASLAGGQNFAYGIGWLGPLAGESPPPPGSLAANQALYFGSQVDAALGRFSGVLPSDALYVVSIGSNDLSFFGRTVDQADDVANLAVQHIQRLYSAGARSFLVQTLGGTTPYVLTYNQTLLGGLGAINGLQLSVVDTRSFNQNVVLAPGFLASIGITEAGTCLADPVCKAAAIAKTTNGEQFLGNTHFNFDDVHRDTKLAQALANYAITQLPQTTVPEPSTVVLVAGGLLGAAFLRRRRR